ncbi:helix-turn-helix domain-containing protein [Streptomyces sp. MUM 178J]|uniref:helix-turn-helix domain-containing protein n=1 Tax=Streptomyces sp. MUM 178J TaxID=2791991 RepID=UPI001F033FDE|nr:helix-turn-helix transcriptional regulator [Streptomyces sp. MUM 178J]WRQ83381.1 helix-turn-helix transcriptional regulator [Streptomyces sp. MUM 178J]
MAALFGSRVRRLRLTAGLTQAQLGERAHTHSTRINQIERTTGHKPTLALAQALDDALQADSLLVDLWPHVYREAFPDWSRAFMDHSAQATAIWEYAAHTVPGLLQTEDYARAVLLKGRTLRTAQQLEERLAGRLGRQGRIGDPDGPDLWVVLDEAVLLRPVGGRTVMRDQLARLLRTEQEPRITLQVLPFSSGEHQAMGGSLTLLDLPDGSEVAYTEGADYGQLIEEPEEVKSYAVTYDHLRALALPPDVSLDTIRSLMEGNGLARVPSRPQRRSVAQKQLQQPGGWQLRRGSRESPRCRPRA